MSTSKCLEKLNRFKKQSSVIGVLFFFCFSTLSLVLLSPMSAHAVVAGNSLQASPKISFTFDDGLASTATTAEPILAQYGLTGTDYIITGCVGMTTVPNTCNANGDTTYMTWSQIQALQNTDGWEIGSHTVDHVCLASSAETDPSDCANPAPLTTVQVDAELANSQSALAANGINATDFAPPYGDYNNSVLAQIAKYYATMRQFKNAANNSNVWPYSDYYLQSFVVQEKTDTVADVEAAVNNAIANNQWLVLTFHNIEAKPSQKPDNYEYGSSELTQIAAYVQAEQNAGLIQSMHIDQGYVSSSINMLPDGSFEDGIADGWTTDSPSTITADGGGNGSYPDPTNSISLVSTTKDEHLFSPEVAVDPSTTYMFKSFLNEATNTGGQVGFYIDEYDANGNWISGQWKAGEPSSFVEEMNFSYKPSSMNVSYASLQVIVTANSGITAYLANCQMFPLDASTLPSTSTNLVPNGTFDAGISDGWTTDDPADIIADSGNNGSPVNPINSTKLISSTHNTHLFSPQVAINSADTYSIGSYLNLEQISNVANGSEVAFYIDEYNSSGNWISGQYKVGDHTAGVGNIGFQYTPSSANVTSASLQVILVGNSNIIAYLDNITWYQN